MFDKNTCYYFEFKTGKYSEELQRLQESYEGKIISLNQKIEDGAQQKVYFKYCLI